MNKVLVIKYFAARLTRRVPIGAWTCGLSLLIGSSAAGQPADETVTFEGLSDGELVQHQYADRGVFFVSGQGQLLPVIVRIPNPNPWFAPNHVANFGVGGGEFYTPSAKGVFTTSRQRVGLAVGYLGYAEPGNETAQITLRAFNAQGQLLAQTGPVTVHAGRGVSTPLQVESAQRDIAAFEVRGQPSLDSNKPLAFDNLTFDVPPAPLPPDFGLSTELSVVLGQGGSVSVPISINRLNGSVGALQFSAAGLPGGVTAAFSPNPADGQQVFLTLTATEYVLPNGADPAAVTIKASPLDANAGMAERTVPLLVFLRANYTLTIEGADTVEVGPCLANQVTVRVTRDHTFQGAVTLAVTRLPPLVEANFQPPLVDFQNGNLMNTSVLRFAVAPGANFQDAWVVVEASSGNLLPTRAVVKLVQANGEIVSFRPNRGEAPYALRPGTEVSLAGRGFCPGAVVRFGNTDALATPTFVSPDGTELRVRVPRLATDGPLVLLKPDGSQLVSAESFQVRSFRNTLAYAFVNSADFQSAVGGYGFNEVQELFGYDQTHVAFPNPLCPWICPDIVVEDPFAHLLASIASEVLDQGQCQGFALSSQRLLHGDRTLTDFPFQANAAEPTLWNLQGPEDLGGPSAALSHFIHLEHLAQLGAEYLHHWLTTAAWNLTQANSRTIYQDLIEALNAGEYPMLAIRDGISGHVVVAYDLEAIGFNEYLVHVYDPNLPFIAAENNLLGGLHRDREERSRIHVTANNRWSKWHNDRFWSGSFDTLVIVRYQDVPLRPSLPTSLKGLTTLIFGGAVQTTQLADDAGRTWLGADGHLNLEPATRLPEATQFAPLAGPAVGGAQIVLLGAEGTYTHTVRGTGAGSYSTTLLGFHYVARLLDVPVHLDLHDTVRWDTDRPGIQFVAETTGKPLTLEVTVRAPDGAVRTARLTTTSSSGDLNTLAFYDSERAQATYRHGGPATSCSLTLTQADAWGTTRAFTASPLYVDAGGTIDIAPADWTDLATGVVTLTYTDGAGHQREEVYGGAGPAELPSIRSQPHSHTVDEAADATFAVRATGTTPLAYQWQFNDTDLAGATDPTLALTQVTAAHAGAYRVRVSNSAGWVMSDPATLFVRAAPVEVIRIEVQRLGTGLELAFEAVPGRRYVVECSEHLTAGSWRVLQEVPAVALAQQLAISDGLSEGVRFYRVLAR
ncbi:MAG: immunoglobulin domain-containing protein [Verrucomicrobia bacterium]|nr:immunoglobulin domain-containing protein [Verrucomicrobiota bacterium]